METDLSRPEPVEPAGGEPAVRPPPGELRPGDVLDGRFAIEEVISRGGMATIFKARDRLNQNAVVAVKVPHRDYEMNPVFFARFQREEEIGVELDHPYVLKFIRVETPRSRPYLVTEYLRGCTLWDLLWRLKVFPEADALAITALMCEALQYLHEHGVIHRDLKPENVMVCFDGTIRIMDLGVSRGADSRRLTFIGFAPGTPHYMAPERVKGRRGDARTDIYSLGAMLYEMLTGVVAFAHEDPLVIMNSRVTGDPEPLRKLNPRISPAAEEIVLRAMDRNPSGRYGSAAAMKSALDSPGDVVLTGRCDRLEASTPWKRGLRKAGHIALWALVPVLVQVLLFLVFWLHFRKK